MEKTVTVLMPVYNSEKHLESSINSIINQTFCDFEFLIINDCSTDKSEDIILTFTDKRIRYLKNKNNIGVAKTLNRGFLVSNGNYIARMDADDISNEKRLEIQVDFMNRNLDIVLCGSYFNGFGDYCKEYRYPTSNEEIKISLLKSNVIGHPTVILRRNSFINNNLFYSSNFLYCEDYELWTRAIRYFKLANIPEVLLCHRKHENQISTKFRNIQKSNDFYIKLNQFEYVMGKLKNEEQEICLNFFELNDSIALDRLNIFLNIFLKKNSKIKFYHESLLREFINHALILK